MKRLKNDLQTVTKEFKALTKKTKELTDKLKKTAAGQLEKAHAAIRLKSPAQRAAEALNILTRQTEKLIKAVDRFEKDRGAKKAKAKPSKRLPAKRAPRKRATTQTATDQVVNIIKRSKKGIDTPTLIKKTGFEDKKIRNILFRATKQGKIRKAGRGIYVGT
jgi:hypothetical protein